MSVPILMYHEVGPRTTERYSVSTEAFRTQLQYLRDHGYQAISLAEYRALTNVDAARKKVVLTFDDNNLCHYSVSTPLLLEFGFRATFFVVTSFIDTEPHFVTSEQLRSMQRDGMWIESHSHTHRFLSELNDDDLRDELQISRRELEKYLQSQVHFISCPGGRYSRRVLDVAQVVGYRGVCTSAPGLNGIDSHVPCQELNRFLVSVDTSFDVFTKMVSGDRRFTRSRVRRHRLKATLKHLLGNNVYDKLWQRYRKEF